MAGMPGIELGAPIEPIMLLSIIITLDIRKLLF
jgi:hypothetical protein